MRTTYLIISPSKARGSGPIRTRQTNPPGQDSRAEGRIPGGRRTRLGRIGTNRAWLAVQGAARSRPGLACSNLSGPQGGVVGIQRFAAHAAQAPFKRTCLPVCMVAPNVQIPPPAARILTSLGEFAGGQMAQRTCGRRRL